MTDRIVDILFEISTGLLAPTLIVLLILMGAILLLLGGITREFLDRRVHLATWRAFLAKARSTGAWDDAFYDLRLVGYPALFQARTRDARHNPLVARKCLEDLELDMARRMAWLTFAIRVGPMLGLVGTLVPLGPALMGLAAGDIQSLSGNLVIAFTTTVFGILVGGGAFTGNLIRRAWYEQDLSDLEYLADLREHSARLGTNGAGHPNGLPLGSASAGAGSRAGHEAPRAGGRHA